MHGNYQLNIVLLNKLERFNFLQYLSQKVSKSLLQLVVFANSKITRSVLGLSGVKIGENLSKIANLDDRLLLKNSRVLNSTSDLVSHQIRIFFKKTTLLMKNYKTLYIIKYE